MEDLTMLAIKKQMSENPLECLFGSSVIVGLFSLFVKKVRTAVAMYLRCLVFRLFQKHMTINPYEDPSLSPTFSQLSMVLLTKVENSRIICPLRRVLFKDFVHVVTKVLNENLRDSLRSDFESMPKSTFSQHWMMVLANIQKDIMTEAKNEDIPLVAISKFMVEVLSKIRVAGSMIILTSNFEIVSFTMTQRARLITDFFGVVYMQTLDSAETELDKLNGDISELTYKGLSCKLERCQAPYCPHRESALRKTTTGITPTIS